MADNLARDFYTDLLEDVGEDRGLAEELIEENQDLRTVSWATTSDVTHLEKTWDVYAHSLRERLQESERYLYRGPHHRAAGKLYVPERKQTDGDESSLETNTQQAGFDQFSE